MNVTPVLQQRSMSLHEQLCHERTGLLTHAGEQGLLVSQALQADGELDIAGSNHVLDLKVLEGGGEAELLHDLSVLWEVW